MQKYVNFLQSPYFLFACFTAMALLFFAALSGYIDKNNLALAFGALIEIIGVHSAAVTYSVYIENKGTMRTLGLSAFVISLLVIPAGIMFAINPDF